MTKDSYSKIFWLCAGLFILYMPIARGAVRVWSISPYLICITSLFGAWCMRKIKTPLLEIKKLRIYIPISIFVILSVFSMSYSIYLRASIWSMLRLFSYAILFFLAVNNYEKIYAGRFIEFTVFLGAFLSLYGLLQYFNLIPHPWWADSKLLSSTYVNHNHFSGFLELVMPVSAGLFFQKGMGGKLLKVFYVLSFIIMCCAFVFSQSRGAWISFFLATLVFFGIMVKNKKIKFRTVMVFILLIAAYFAVMCAVNNDIFERFLSVRDVNNGEPSMDARINIWKAGVKMLRDDPVTGTGIGNFVYRFSKYRPGTLDTRTYYAHNDYLHMAVETGIMVVPFMFWMIAILLKKGFSRSADPVIRGCAVGILSLSIHGFVDFNFHIPANMVLVVMYAGIISRWSLVDSR